MIIVNAEAVVEEGAIEKVRAALAKMEKASLAEPGCHVYAFSTDISDPTMVRITERWESMEALEAHFKMPHMAEFMAAMGDLQPSSVDIKCYEIAREVPLPS